MKKYISIITIAVCCITMLIGSCSKKDDATAPTTSPNGNAFIKISQFSPNFRQTFNNRDSFNIYVNNVKVNGTFLTYGSIYPSVTNLYAAVPAGPAAIKISIVGVNSLDSIVVSTINKTLTAGSYYSFIMTDSVLNTNESKQIFLQDNFVRSDTSHFTVRFVHAILNDTTGKNVDVYSTRLASNVFSNISPGTVTPFIAEPYNLIADTLIVRRAGSAFELARLSTVATAINRERAYTLVYKGTPLTTGTKPRSLIFFPNQ